MEQGSNPGSPTPTPAPALRLRLRPGSPIAEMKLSSCRLDANIEDPMCTVAAVFDQGSCLDIVRVCMAINFVDAPCCVFCCCFCGGFCGHVDACSVWASGAKSKRGCNRCMTTCTLQMYACMSATTCLCGCCLGCCGTAPSLIKWATPRNGQASNVVHSAPTPQSMNRNPTPTPTPTPTPGAK